MPLSPSTKRLDSSHVYENTLIRISGDRKSEEIKASRGRSNDQSTRRRLLHKTNINRPVCNVSSPHSSRSQRFSKVPSQFIRDLHDVYTCNQVPDQTERLQMLAGFSKITLRELITDYVLELLKSHPNLNKHTRSPEEARALRSPNDPCQFVSSSSNKSNRVLSVSQPTEDVIKKLELKSNSPLPKVGGIPRTHLKLYQSLPFENTLSATGVCSAVSPSSIRSKALKLASANPCSGDQNQNNPDKLANQHSTYIMQRRNQVRNLTPNECSSYRSRSHTKSPKSFEANRDIQTDDPYHSTLKHAAVLSVRSGLRNTRAHSANGTLKKLRFEREKDVHSPI